MSLYQHSKLLNTQKRWHSLNLSLWAPARKTTSRDWSFCPGFSNNSYPFLIQCLWDTWPDISSYLCFPCISMHFQTAKKSRYRVYLAKISWEIMIRETNQPFLSPFTQEFLVFQFTIQFSQPSWLDTTHRHYCCPIPSVIKSLMPFSWGTSQILCVEAVMLLSWSTEEMKLNSSPP